MFFQQAKAIGAFPHATPRYVRLLVENPSVSVNENNGLYLLMADPATGLVDARARTAAVVRRRNDAKRAESEQKGKPDVKLVYFNHRTGDSYDVVFCLLPS